MTVFAEWSGRYVVAAPAGRSALLAEGVALAKQRRVLLKQWIREDPQRALAAAIPMTIRQQLPAEIVSVLEERVSGQGEIARVAAMPEPGGGTVAEPEYHEALIGNRECRAFLYGRRKTLNTLPQASLIGIAVDGVMAVSDSPVRVLETGETAEGRPVDTVCPVSGITTEIDPVGEFNSDPAAPTALEANGRIQVVCSTVHLQTIEANLIAAESAGQEVVAGNNLPGTSGVVGRPTYAWTHGSKKGWSSAWTSPISPARR